jgi:pimeloyl-ACP methyl ester carboxylesterase
MPGSARATTSDGVRLALHRREATGTPRSVALFVHAMMASSSYFDRAGFLTALAARGVDCWAVDLRGHGDSVPPDARRGDWTFDDYVERDLPAALDHVARATGRRVDELDYVGHSLGGLVGLAAFGAGTVPPPRRLILVATNVWRLGRSGDWKRRGLLFAMEASARFVGRVPARRVGAGTDDEPASYVSQMRRWAASHRWTSLRGLDYEAALGRIAAPTLVIAADRDGYCLPHHAREMAEKTRGPLTVRVAGRLRGDAADSDHFGYFVDAAFGRTLWPEVADFLIR